MRTKRAFDILLSSILIVLLFPVLLLLTPIILYKLGYPLFFTQTRAGMHGKKFLLYKLRTMTNEKNEQGELLPDEHRLTRFGKTLRSTSLDEVPQLWNVLKGEMSLVGPRPLYLKYVPLYSKHQARRLQMKPGITGWAQVNGRNQISWENKFDLDVWYIDNQTFIVDLKILFLTLLKSIKREGITQMERATADEFTGSNTNRL